MCSPTPRKQLSTPKAKEVSLDIVNEGFVLEICDCYVQTDINDSEIEDQESGDDISLINETGSIEDALEAKSFWNEQLSEKDHSNGDEAKDSKLLKSSGAKVEAWLSSNSKLLTKSTVEIFPKITEGLNEKFDTTLSKGVSVKRKLVFEEHLPEPKKLKCSPKKSWLSSISGWVSGIFR